MLETAEGAEIEYDLFNRMVRYEKGTDVYTYTYNGDGQRLSKTVNGVTTEFTWDGMDMILESSGSTTSIYVYGNGINYRKTGSTVYTYTTNAHGDVVNYAQGTTVVKEYCYDAFGNELDEYDSRESENPLRYCGEYYDAETGLYYLRNRYYDPKAGRFITEDPIRDGNNWYVYCNGNPVMFTDPMGLDSYIFYDPNMFGEGTGYEFALTDKKMLEDYYGTPCHLIDIWSAEGFIYNWNNRIGTDGNGTIDAVVVFSHSYWSTLIFGSGDQSSEVRDVNLDVINSKLESRTMKVLLLLGCHTGETNKDVNLATTFAKNNNIGILVASDGKTFHTEGGTNHTIDSQTVDENGNKRDGFKK